MNPEQMTKNQLQDVLVANNIDLPPPNAVKSAYIKLYRDNARKILEASANKSKKTDSEIIEVVKFLSNSQIASKLRNLGLDIGPVNASTRKVYLKMLAGRIVRGECSLEEDSALIQINIHRSEGSSIRNQKSSGGAQSPSKSVNLDDDIFGRLPASPSAIRSATPRRPLRSFLSSSAAAATSSASATFTNQVNDSHVKEDKQEYSFWKTIIIAILVILFAYIFFDDQSDVTSATATFTQQK